MPGKTEYMKRPLIEDVSYEISETRVLIQSPHTCFVSCVLPARCQKDEMLSQYRKVIKMAKARGVRVSYSRHIQRTIRERWSDYLAERKKQESLFQELQEVTDIIRRRGIHIGHADDEELAKAYEIAGELAKLHYGDKAVSNIAGLEYELQMLERQLTEGRGHHDMIAL